MGDEYYWMDDESGRFVDFKHYFEEYWTELDQREQARADFEGPNNIVLKSGESEMLRVAEDGFYVRGVKVEADEKEAKVVYDAFKQWLTWATLSKDK